MTLCTEANVEAIVQEDIPDGDIDDLITLVSGYLEGYIGRTFDDGNTITHNATAGPAASAIFLPHWPLTSVTTVTEDGTILTAGDDYRVNLTAGIITRLASTGLLQLWDPDPYNVEVVYTPAIPGDLRALAARIVARIWRAGDTSQNIVANHPEMEGLTQLTVGQWSATIDRDAIDPAGAFDLNDIDMFILDGYLDRLAA